MLKQLIIKVTNQYIYLSPSLGIPLTHTNIPYQHCRFRENVDIFWKVELIEYNENNHCWKLIVLDYFVEEISNFTRQKSTKPIEKLAFEKFYWPHLERQLSTYQKIKLVEVLLNHDTDGFFQSAISNKKPLPKKKLDQNTSISQNGTDSPHADMREYKFSIAFNDISFKLGYVSFRKKIKDFPEELDFKITNDFILPEFDHIKSWFARQLKTRKIDVIANIHLLDGMINLIRASSPHIARINAQMIDSIKYNRTFALTKPTKFTVEDKSLFTADQIFNELASDELEGNVFNQNEQDILSFLMDDPKVRNRRQLEYLSGRKQAEGSKIRFTLHPNFGFLFLITGERNNHFVWELLNSHATYIWTFEKSYNNIELQFKRIEDSINSIRDFGREQYKRAYRQSHHDSDLIFSVIEHDDIQSALVDGFVKWKHRLNERIT